MPTPQELAQMQALAAAGDTPDPLPDMPQPGPAVQAPEPSLQIPQFSKASQVGHVLPPGEDLSAQPSTGPAATPTQYVSAPQQQTQNPYAVAAMLPGGSSTSVSQVQTGAKGKEAEKAAGDAFKATESAAKQSNDIAVQKAQAIAQGETARAAEFDKGQKAVAAAAANVANQTHAQAAKVQASVDDFNRSTQDIDSNRFWAKQSTGQKLGNILAIALSGVGNALSARGGNPNARNGALDMINLAIDRDIEAQRLQLQAKERGMSMQMNAYSVARDAGAADVEAARYAAAAGTAKAESDLQAQLARLGPGEQKARGEQLLAQLQAQRAQQLQEAALQTAQRVQSTTSSVPVLAGQLQAAQDADQRKAAGLVPEDPKLTTPYGQAPDQETRRGMMKEGAKLKLFEANVQKLEAMAKAGYGDRVASPEKRQAWNRAVSGVTAYIAGPEMANAGASLTPEEYKLKVEPFLPGGSAWAAATGKDAEQIKALRDLAELQKKSISASAVKTHL